MHPETERDLRELPRVIADSFGLVSKAGRKELLLTSALQLTIAVGLVVQLFVVKRLFDAVLVAGESDDVGSIVPELAALVGIGMLLSLAQAVLAEQNRVLAELVGRRAFDGVLNVATRVDLLAFESPDFYDRLIRARHAGTVPVDSDRLGPGGPVRCLRRSCRHRRRPCDPPASTTAAGRTRVRAAVGRVHTELTRPLHVFARDDAQRPRARVSPHSPARAGTRPRRFEPSTPRSSSAGVTTGSTTRASSSCGRSPGVEPGARSSEHWRRLGRQRFPRASSRRSTSVDGCRLPRRELRSWVSTSSACAFADCTRAQPRCTRQRSSSTTTGPSSGSNRQSRSDARRRPSLSGSSVSRT